MENEELENIKKEENDDNEEIAFIEYQENINHSKQAKRNRLLLIALSSAIYLLGLGLFATIVQTLYQINNTLGIVVGLILLILYTICYIVILVEIFSKQSFDIEYKKRNNQKFSERKNNIVRFEIAKNIKEQSIVLDYLQKANEKEYLNKNEAEKVDAFLDIIEISNKYNNKIPTYHNEDSIKLAKAIDLSFRKDGIIYKKAKTMIIKRAISTGCLTALSQNNMVDMSIVAIKNIQLIKDIIWLYGFRPTDYEMNKIMFKIIRNISISIGLNNMPKNANLLSKIFHKDSSNFLIQLFGQVLDMGAQFLGNGTMTYLVGRYTIKTLLKQYHIQEILRQENLNDYEIELSSLAISQLNDEIKKEVKKIKNEGKKEEEPLLLEEKKKENIFKKIFHKKETK